ncbi:MAG: GDSL family lipase, partial [Gammaproteobacteria bacterium]
EGGAYLPFKSARWEAFYRGQIQRILKAAKKHHVQVLWVGVPNMRKNKLNQGIHYLNTLYRSEAQKAGIHYLPTNALFGYDDHRYHKYATTAAGKKIAVRTKDGIHFTRSGQKRIANKILSLIQVQ